MRQIYPDLWQTSTEHPIAEMPEVIYHAYLLILDAGNVLFYSIGREEAGSDGFPDDLQRIQDVGGYLPGGESNKSDLRESIELLRTLRPDVVFSAAALGDDTFKEVSPADWQAGLDEALRPLM